MRSLEVDLLLLPIARHFDDDVHDESEWEASEIYVYGNLTRRAIVPTLLGNYLSPMDGCFGGAVAYDASGSVLASQPLHRAGLLLVDLAFLSLRPRGASNQSGLSRARRRSSRLNPHPG